MEEVRVAMALNGGVSLAIWMGGCAVEVDCARRAQLGAEPIGGHPTRTVYATICEALDRRLVVDVMSGSSAGGINGALLAAAIVARRRLHPDFLRSRWLDLGDLARLLQLLTAPDPYSLMRGKYFYDGLLKAFEDVFWEQRDKDDPEPLNAAPFEPETLAPPPFLDVTTTDVVGAPLEFADVWGDKLTALEYRARYRFRTTDDYKAATLAAAARSSASFPVAFEPYRVRDANAKRLAGFTGEFDRSVIDGGLLDNAPIASAIDMVKARPATGLVKRYLCYVNGDPKDVTKELDVGDPQYYDPRLGRVLANVLGLPRKAPFADQLKALEEASWRGRPTLAAELGLLALELETLGQTAASLFELYCARRRMVSLRELIDAPALTAFNRLGDGNELPWIPQSLEPPAPGEWGWGVQTARRVHHLMIDLVRGALFDGRDPEVLLEARSSIDDNVRESERRRRTAVDSDPLKAPLVRLATERQADAAEAVAEVSAAKPWEDGQIRSEVRSTAQIVQGVAGLLDQDGVQIGPALFGDGWDGPELTDEMFAHFLRRVLSIEVVRRAFGMERDIDDSQPLPFAQLTPFAPCPLLDERPLTGQRDWSPEIKLTGIRLGHFAAFYRRSWRANDFLWGRLDGASRAVSMLLDGERAGQVDAPWVRLAAALVPDAPEGEERWTGERAFVAELHRLAGEALDDAKAPPAHDLRARVATALEYDLSRGAQGGVLARAMCIRAAQLEVLAHELPSLIAEAKGDAALGASSVPLTIPSGAERLGDAVQWLREQKSLPEQLARDAPAELVSNLALRTASRGGLVSLAVLRGSRLPMMSPLQILRATFLSLAGMVSSRAWTRALVVLGFAACVLYLAARAQAVDDRSSDVQNLRFNSVVGTLVCLLLIVGVIAVPALRAWARGSPARWLHGVVAAIIVVGVGAGAVVAALIATPSWIDALVASSFQPPAWLFWCPFLLILGTLPRFIPAALARMPVLHKPWYPVLGVPLAVISAATVGAWSFGMLRGADVWVWVSVIAAVATALFYILLPRRVSALERRLAPPSSSLGTRARAPASARS